MALGKSGAKNAGIFAAQIIAGSDPAVEQKLAAFKSEMSAQVEKKSAKFENYR